MAGIRKWKCQCEDWAYSSENFEWNRDRMLVCRACAICVEDAQMYEGDLPRYCSAGTPPLEEAHLMWRDNEGHKRSYAGHLNAFFNNKVPSNETAWLTHTLKRTILQPTNTEPTRDRYRHKFHWNERMSQLALADPSIPTGHWERIEEEADSGLYGPIEHFTQPVIFKILKNLNMAKFRESWRTILHRLTRSEIIIPQGHLIEMATATHISVQQSFDNFYRTSIPTLTKSIRHNTIPFNYVFRKMLESMNIWCFHQDLPILKSHTKLLIFDRVMKDIYENLGISFIPTVIIKRPKLKYSNH